MNNEFTGEKKVCSCQEDLLLLIENQDVFNILSEENMDSFNELMKYELITVKEDKVYLTPLGKEAQVHGVKNVIGRKNVERITTRVPTANSNKNRKIFIIGFISVLLLILLFIALKYFPQQDY